jgi:pimeloyl-ACP methyl ester carboxylesterase
MSGFRPVFANEITHGRTKSGTVVPARKWRDPSPHAARFANVGRLRLHYLDWGGQGNVLLFLPGLGQSAHIFDGLAPHFTSHHRVLGLTLRGQGKSDRPESGYDTATLVDDLQGFLDTQHVGTVSLISHSMSGNQATEFARRYPQRVKKLIYIEAAMTSLKCQGLIVIRCRWKHPGKQT